MITISTKEYFDHTDQSCWGYVSFAVTNQSAGNVVETACHRVGFRSLENVVFNSNGQYQLQINGKKLMFIDDSIVRGTQLRETVDFLYKSGAREVHMRSACPPIMYGCKYLNFSRSNSEMELLARKKIQELEGDEGQKHIEEYADGTTKRGQCP